MPLRPPVGVSLHVGLNEFDVGHYGIPGTLANPEHDAEAMQALAIARGFETRLLLRQQATADAVLDGIRAAADRLVAGDIFFLSYAGHGSRIKDVSGDEEEGFDSTFCLYDRMLVDDELWAAWRAFRPGVRIVVVADSCHSGTAVRELAPGLEEDGEDTAPIFPPRALTVTRASFVYKKNQALYDEILATVRGSNADPVAAAVVLLAACQDNQTAADGGENAPDHGLFTGSLLLVNEAGATDYTELHRKVVRGMPPVQSPNLYVVGTPNPAFLAERPFTIGSAPFGTRDPGDGRAAATNGNANLRSAPSLSASAVVRVLPKGTPVVVVGNDTEWLQVKVGTDLAWLHMSVVDAVAGASGSWSTVATTELNIRSGPAASRAKVGSIAAGGTAEVLGWDGKAKWFNVRHDGVSGWVSAAYVRGLVLPAVPDDGPLDTPAIRALRAQIDAGDPALRASRYEALQARVIYRSQRDNEATLGGAKVEKTTGSMCNLTSLAMALSVLGIDNPKPERQYEDALEMIRQINGFADRTTSAGWGAVARAMGAEVSFLRDAPFKEARAWWIAKVKPALAAGQGVIMSISGHIVRVEAITDAGVVVDDPYGHCHLLAGEGRSWIAKNPYGAPGNVGDSVTFPWAEVEIHTMRWCAAFARSTRGMDTFLTELPSVRDDEPSDADEE